MKRVTALLCSLLLFSACSSLDYSKSYWGARDFQPKKMIILPVLVGGHDTAQELVEDVLVKSLWGTGWYDQLIAPNVIKARSIESPEFSKLISDYTVKLHTLGESDEAKAKKIGQTYKADAILLMNMTSWGYGLVKGDKMAWLNLEIILVDAKTGDIMWKGKHRRMEDYLLVQPVLREICQTLLSEMLAEMPH